MYIFVFAFTNIMYGIYVLVHMMLKILSSSCRWCPIPVCWLPSARSGLFLVVLLYYFNVFNCVVIAQFKCFKFFVCLSTVWWFFTRALYQIITWDYGHVLPSAQVPSLLRVSVYPFSFQPTHLISQRCSLYNYFSLSRFESAAVTGRQRNVSGCVVPCCVL